MYEITVVTPFHDIDLRVFQKAFDSLRAQTLGFERLEWIVVVHNSPAQAEDISRMVAGYENVRVDVLNNAVHSPSSPRNRGLALATAPYVAFLDGDDQFTPDCLRTVISHLRDTGAQIAWFRREYELESADSTPVTEIVLWNQTYGEIIIDRDHWDDEKMFSGVCGMVTSRCYDRVFLQEHGIRFDEEVPFGEDYLFNLEAYGKAEKICYLPQLIGYHYYINGGSLVQSGARKADALVSYARGYTKIFEAGLKHGFFMNAIISSLCCVLAKFMDRSENLTMAQRMEIRDLLAPYIELTTPLRVSKVYTEQAARERYELPREVILHPEKYDKGEGREQYLVYNVAKPEENSPYLLLLHEILERNAATDVGERFGFAGIRTVEGFKARVPILNSDFYQPLIRLQTNIGESGIFTADRILAYTVDFSPMGLPRMLPVTERLMNPLVGIFRRMVRDRTSFLLMESLPVERKYNDRTVYNTLFGVLLTRYFSEHSADGERTAFSAPRELIFPRKSRKHLYARLLFALRERAVDQILAPSAWGVWEAFAGLEKYWPTLCDDIEQGTISSVSGLPKDQREGLGKYIRPDPERAAELRAIFTEGFGTPVAQKIWRKLERVVAVGTGSYRVYADAVKRYLGDVEWLNGFYFTMEAVWGYEGEERGQYRLTPIHAVPEFLPLEDPRPEAARMPEEVRAGEMYTLLATTQAGLYRYALDSVIRIRKVEDGVPVFTDEYRKSECLTLRGETLTEPEIYNALRRLAEERSWLVTDYAYMAEGPELVILAETRGRMKAAEAETDALSRALDALLAEESPGWRRIREAEGPEHVRLRFLEEETQMLYRDMTAYRTGCAPDQIRPVRLLNTPARKRFFEKH